MKRFGIAATIIAICFVVTAKVSAAYYSTTLVLPDNGYVSGKSRSYKTGDHILDMSIDSYYTTCSINSNKTRVQLIGSSRTLADVVLTTRVGTSIYKNFGNFYTDTKRYTFNANVYYEPYCGIKSNTVRLYPR